jgi:hypothetical protein
MVFGCSELEQDLTYSDEGQTVLTRSHFESVEPFYYYFGEKIFFKQSTDRIFIRFMTNVNREQISSLTNKAASSLKQINDAYWNEGTIRFMTLESDDGKQFFAPFDSQSLKKNNF